MGRTIPVCSNCPTRLPEEANFRKRIASHGDRRQRSYQRLCSTTWNHGMRAIDQAIRFVYSERIRWLVALLCDTEFGGFVAFVWPVGWGGNVQAMGSGNKANKTNNKEYHGSKYLASDNPCVYLAKGVDKVLRQVPMTKQHICLATHELSSLVGSTAQRTNNNNNNHDTPT
jgi:hypothetical protein